MTSIIAQTVGFAIRKTGLFRRLPTDMANFPAFHAKTLAKASAPSARNRKGCRASSREIEGQRVWTLAPLDGSAKVQVLFWHGGAFLYPPTAAHWDFLVGMVRRHGWEITLPLYPLAPQAQVDQVAGFALRVYGDWVNQPGTGPRILAGDSAGGGLAAATLLGVRDAGLVLPDGVVLMCPWLDLNMDHPDQAAIEPRDAILSRRGLRVAGQLYAGDNGADNARASPLRGNWADLPPLLMFGGGDDILVTDARSLKAKAPDVTYVEAPGLIHDWPILFFPESRAAQAKMARFSLTPTSNFEVTK
ncbi:alpha/beta hydrolase fold domain-containing protein [Celeribacter baekdonensis]|uniref:alpha/beta hydrolase fold domain-containing protein n=1 Tax=Celeribacter baekdonensis TaxID=875171 RepID=UPI0030DD6C41|tara:strand:- start:87734 stop:88642 length:909 start_codon:yes stop_codon:yes gene_type:complete